MLSGANSLFFSCIAAWITNIFSLRENFSLFEVFPRYLLSFYCRCIDIYHPSSLQFSIYFFVKTTLILYLTSNFFFLRENHSLFFILFLDKAHLYNGAALLFLCPVFFFFFVKSSLRSLLRSSYIWHCCFPYCFFLFTWNFLAISCAHPCYLLYPNVISLSFLSEFFLFLCENHSLFNRRASSFLT